jgi:hypothetical protein
MEYKIVLLALVLLTFTTAGCESKSDPRASDASKAAPKSRKIAPNGLPADWTNTTEISLTKTESPEGVLNATLTGKRASFNGIVETIRGNVTKPINFGAEVDADQVLPEFEIKMDDGSWPKLLTAVAEKFECVVEESNSEFLIVPAK